MFDIQQFKLAFSQLIDNDLDEALLPISHYHFQKSGLFIRSGLAYNCASTFGLSTEIAKHCAAIIECLHNASIIHDDIQDQATTRRGQPSLVKQFSMAKALVFGDFLISKSYHLCAELPANYIAHVINLVHQYVHQTIAGQMQDINAIKHETIDIDTYQTICWLKSGQLMMLAVHLPALLANQQRYCSAFEDIMRHLVVSFQLLDDITDKQEDQIQQNFSIFNVYENNSIIRLNQAYHLAKQQFDASKQALARLPTQLQQPFFKIFKQIETKLVQECV